MTIQYFDIETEPADAETLKAFEPEFEAPRNLKDAAKIAAAIEEKRADWLERAALSPITGRVLAIGYFQDDALWTECVGQGKLDERTLIARFFDNVLDCSMGARKKLAGFNIHDFDLPFIVRRALALELPIPSGMLPAPGAGRFYWPSWFIDIRDVWGMGEHQPAGSLDVIGRFLGLGGKSGKGADFARLYHGTPEERARAIAYLERDLQLTQQVGRKLGVY